MRHFLFLLKWRIKRFFGYKTPFDFDPAFLAALRFNTPLRSVAEVRSLPARTGNQIVFFRYEPVPADGGGGVRGNRG